MRLVHWKEFIALPDGTIFSEARSYNGGDIEDVKMKGETLFYGRSPNDYCETSLLPNVRDASSIHHDSYPDPGGGDIVLIHPSGWGRNGMYEKDRMYWVWDQEDRERLAKWLLNPQATAATEELNEDNVRWRGDREAFDPKC
ncbi:hypothetical protein ASD54_08770 [Rhizobium sp. Root149]|jgi:hypothetical protein|uniref:hypothetical protein n=1 Tax=Rhizobium sp. Root149 TaxID=1736473 RepID=UPI0007146361|nr:hypothetical protein [Rhizobium sp. Root149]KQZ50338.1 hypothetical protein ASD54_08770 [Rhizobium sp. Root149]